MVNSTYYFAIWLPLLSFGIAFYIATLFVLFKKMKDSILGKIFFKIHLVLGIVEILCVSNVVLYKGRQMMNRPMLSQS
uniref:Cytochrome b561 domain-containing protein n=1 Tax=Acrobeloides nanus TaxID=290746 RepID=A0A914CEC9_9BILA